MKCTICCPVPVTNGTACAISCASIRRWRLLIYLECLANRARLPPLAWQF